jgi:hypothetical protein
MKEKIILSKSLDSEGPLKDKGSRRMPRFMASRKVSAAASPLSPIFPFAELRN